jgi:hypothetical protein
VADWVVISSLATGGGTLALAATTYLSVKSANRAARVAELSLLAGLRPLLVASNESDELQRVNFYDVHGIAVPGARGAVEIVDENIYIVISVRNVGSGIGVLHGGIVHPEFQRASVDPPPVEEFALLSRDIYIPQAAVGFWQIAYRNDDDSRRAVMDAIERGYLTIDILYGDFEGGQRAITRFGVVREDDGAWYLGALRHWQVDRTEPRPRD